jgi:hypothetical protein
MRRRRKLTPGRIIGLQNRIDPHEAQERFRERDARAALDTRTPAQVWLGEPPPGRSALAQASTPASTPQRGTAWRVDLWRGAARLSQGNRAQMIGRKSQD